MSLVVHLPLITYTLLAFQDTPTSFEEASARQGTWVQVYIWGSVLLTSFLAGPVTFDVVERLRGRTPSLGTSLRIGLSRIPRILLTALLQALFLVFLLFAGGILLSIPLALLLAAMPRGAEVVALGVAYSASHGRVFGLPKDAGE